MKSPKVIGGSGGKHLLYKYPSNHDIRNATGLAGYEGLEIRANGGYVVAPPSLHVSGQYYRRDENSPKKPADPPDWFIRILISRSDKDNNQKGRVNTLVYCNIDIGIGQCYNDACPIQKNSN